MLLRNQLSQRIYNFLLFATWLWSIIYASPIPEMDKGDSLINSNVSKEGQQVIQDPRQLVPSFIPAGVIFIVLGFLFCFWGSRWFKIALFVAGFYVFASIAFFILNSSEPSSQFQNRTAVYYGVIIVAGLIGGAIMSVFVKFGVFAIGCVGGYSLAVWLLSLKPEGLINGIMGQKIFIAVVAVLSGLITLFILLDKAIKVMTSIAGAYSIVFGIDMFANTGFKDTVSKFIGSGNIPYIPDTKVYLMIAAVPVLALLGMAVQFKVTGKGERNAFRNLRAKK